VWIDGDAEMFSFAERAFRWLNGVVSMLCDICRFEVVQVSQDLLLYLSFLSRILSSWLSLLHAVLFAAS